MGNIITDAPWIPAEERNTNQKRKPCCPPKNSRELLDNDAILLSFSRFRHLTSVNYSLLLATNVEMKFRCFKNQCF
ncbi:hypothetical protein TcWFU_003419 [Taenia crassiceps]|uniref:Uncharacterized protein n=1 Tax=Taenia crassiceps TaxID=6207 RepID=A0ABR4QKN6_9CEST